MSEWREYRIEDFGEIQNQKRVPLSAMERSKRKGIFPYYGASGIVDYVDGYLFDGEYVLISEDGENLRTRNTPIAFKASGQFWVNNHAHILKCKKDFMSELIVYYFKNLDLNEFISGAVQPKLNKASLTSIPLFLPQSEEEQKAIAAVLSSLDDKIDLLHRQNKTLEAMAETLFRQWFVEEAQEDWEVTSLEAHADVYRGLSYKGSGLTDAGNGLPMHNLNSIFEGGGYKHAGIKYYSGEFKDRHLVIPGDIIVANTEQGHEFRLIGYPAIVPSGFGSRGLFSQHIYKLIPRQQSYLQSEFLYYLLMEPSVREQIISATNGSTVNMLAIDGLQLPKFKLPPRDKVKQFAEIVREWWGKKDNNRSQISTLEKLRDILLPKLMSGEIRIQDA